MYKHSYSFNSFSLCSLLLAVVLMTISCGARSTVHAQSLDSIYKFSGGGGSTKVSGKVDDMTPAGVIIVTRGKKTTIPSQEIRKIVYSGQSSQLDRTRERIMSGSFDQGLTELAKVDDKKDPFVAHEIAFLESWCHANLALDGDKPLKSAGTYVNSFLQKYKKSYHFYPMTELKGRLLQSLKRTDLATAEFKKLSEAQWPEYNYKGHYLLAETLNSQGQHAQAVTECDAILSGADNSDVAQQYKRLATCAKAKSQALAGETAGIEEPIRQLIKVENPDNKKLFAAAYNAWGVYHFKAGRLKEAREKFLMTHLLITSEAEAHAEALFYLSQIWPKLENTDEANKTRELLKSRYRNSYWAQQLN